MWKKFTMDIKERFLNNETLKGAVFLGIAFMLFNPTLLIYVLQAYLVYEGLRKVSVNRIKLELKKARMKAQRVELENK